MGTSVTDREEPILVSKLNAATIYTITTTIIITINDQHHYAINNITLVIIIKANYTSA